MALESQLNAVMIEEGHYTVGETKKADIMMQVMRKELRPW